MGHTCEHSGAMMCQEPKWDGWTDIVDWPCTDSRSACPINGFATFTKPDMFFNAQPLNPTPPRSLDERMACVRTSAKNSSETLTICPPVSVLPNKHTELGITNGNQCEQHTPKPPRQRAACGSDEDTVTEGQGPYDEHTNSFENDDSKLTFYETENSDVRRHKLTIPVAPSTTPSHHCDIVHEHQVTIENANASKEQDKRGSSVPRRVNIEALTQRYWQKLHKVNRGQLSRSLCSGMINGCRSRTKQLLVAPLLVMVILENEMEGVEDKCEIPRLVQGLQGLDPEKTWNFGQTKKNGDAVRVLDGLEMTQLAALVKIVELHRLILNTLSWADLRAYGLSCKTIMKDVDEYIEGEYNIEGEYSIDHLLMNFLPREHIRDFPMVEDAIVHCNSSCDVITMIRISTFTSAPSLDPVGQGCWNAWGVNLWCTEELQIYIFQGRTVRCQIHHVFQGDTMVLIMTSVLVVEVILGYHSKARSVGDKKTWRVVLRPMLAGGGHDERLRQAAWALKYTADDKPYIELW
ncbi:hypothetical protein BDN71DRAFT_1433001 [Pleurotus eryngii]|uniref:Uncharacterized protein n=1 Tax=Pleurotus eryngii TaxID=5323 RepID=A0A9P6D695_PLEER|nr:hypothetical protein BDN71DRAFT_1433001 [Pleurotus eryngii]